MRVRIKRYPRNAEAGMDDNVGPSEEDVEIPAGPFAWVGAFSGLGTALIALFTFWLVDKPKADVQRGVDAGQAQVQMLQQALQVESADGRKTSVQLLRSMGLLTARNEGRLDSLIASVDSLPRWPAAAGEGDDASASSDPADNGGGGGGKAAEGTGRANQGNRRPAPPQQGLNPETGGTGG